MGRILRDHLLKTTTIPYDKAPTTFITSTRSKIDQDGFRILHQIIYLGSPQLDGEERDLYNYVLTLIITPNVDLVSFYHRDKYTEQEIILQHNTTGHVNRLTKRFLLLLNDIERFQMHLTSMVKSINKFFRQLNHHNLTLTYTIDNIYEELYDTRLDLTLNRKSSTQLI